MTASTKFTLDTYWVLVAVVILGGIKVLFFPTNYDNPRRLLDLAGCFIGPKEADVSLVRFDRAGRMNIGGQTVNVMVTSDKNGEFIETKGKGFEFDEVGQSLFLNIVKYDTSIDMSGDLSAIAFVNSSGGRVVFRRGECP